MSKVDVHIITEALNDPNFSFIETFADAGNNMKVTRELTTLVFKHRQKRDLLKKKERQLVLLKNDYSKKKNQAYLDQASAPNERSKAVLVEIATEEEAYQISIVEQSINELKRDVRPIVNQAVRR